MDRLATLYETKLSAAAIAFVLGMSERQAKAIHARTEGSIERLAGEYLAA